MSVFIPSYYPCLLTVQQTGSSSIPGRRTVIIRSPRISVAYLKIVVPPTQHENPIVTRKDKIMKPMRPRTQTKISYTQSVVLTKCAKAKITDVII